MTEWMDRARCRDVDPELFFPVGAGPAAVRRAELAKKVCLRCTVRAECLRWALAREAGDGVWGGLDAEERRALRCRERRHACPAQLDLAHRDSRVEPRGE